MAKRTAIVTGSARGIGEAIARRLAAENYAVCINDVAASRPEVDKLVAELNDTHGPGTAIGFVADVSQSIEVQALIQESVRRLGPLTVMIANAGIAQVKPILEITEEEVVKIFNVNFLGVWHCYTNAAKQMIAQGPAPPGSTGYKIIGAASILALKPFPLLPHYSVSKWAVRGLTQVFAMEMAKHKISVNCYAPGIVGTDMMDKIDRKLAEMEGKQPGEVAARLSLEMTAMGRVSVPQDVSKVVGGFLCGPDSDFVTGQTIVVDGGIVFT
ncbi:uncharacterized protein PV07_01163 [Cladophialophora immunda]|uniref:Diacetyl reductase [(S)-acetoin forming] n=1 Tax=Cladophialophora immunda TaxID=569365 RepID=A0A0D2CX00_9EURO|nr:uncharacterized protein PV07_01163 [Cladophialophora immunda]KIW34385.1 hypothetical protein PV07_01163 [Cladophialophora immunda]OQV04928.1 hypothetical protein CLAIMM_09740 isoform 2 [Cladophialophora immunda]